MFPLSAQFFVSVCTILVVLNVMLGATAYLILLERKVASWTQDRIGPNRTGFGFGQKKLWDALGLKFMNKFRFLGLGQALADGLKLLVKEDYTPPHTDKWLFTLAPALVMIPAIIGMAVIPWGGEWMFPGLDLFGYHLVDASPEGDPVTIAASTLNVGVLYLLAVGSIGVYGVTIGAYASNNKYAFLGGLRATAQMLSYEVPMGLCVLIMILYYKSPDALAMIAGQTGGAEFSGFSLAHTWGVLAHPLLAAVFFTCVLAECNRAPFDLAECEQELVGGFHTEYGSMKWAMYFLGEYMHMIIGAAFFTLLFLGGWEPLPFLKLIPEASGWTGLLWILVKFAVFSGKVAFLLFAMMWIRWTLPRFRFDQLMRLAWTNLIPMMLAALLASGVLVVLAKTEGCAWAGSWWAHLGADAAVVVLSLLVAPFLPKGPSVNRKVPLEGSRFCPPLPQA